MCVCLFKKKANLSSCLGGEQWDTPLWEIFRQQKPKTSHGHLPNMTSQQINRALCVLWRCSYIIVLAVITNHTQASDH